MKKMNNVEMVKIELIDKGFSQKIVGKYTNLKLFTTNFSPIISTKRIRPRMRWLELVYAMPYLVLKREILNSFKRTKNVFTSVKQIFFIHLEFPLSRYEYMTRRLHIVGSAHVPACGAPPHVPTSWALPTSPKTLKGFTERAYLKGFISREIVKMQDTRYKMQVKPASGIRHPVSFSYVNLMKSRGFYFESPSMALAYPVSRGTTGIEPEKEFVVTNYQVPVITTPPPTASHKPFAASYNYPASYILPRISDLITRPFRHYSIKPAFFLRHKTVPIKPRGVSLDLQKSDTPYGLLATLQKGQKRISYLKLSPMALAQPLSHETSTIRTEKELAFQNYRLPVVSHQPSTASNNKMRTYIPPTTSDFINLASFYIINKKNEQMQLNIQEIEKAPLYHTYPTIEHVTAMHTEIIKERVIEKEDRTPHATPQLPSIDLNRLTDQIYPLLERKVRIERERRGL